MHKLTWEISSEKSTRGADIIITQLFYDNDDFYRFRDACVGAGITVPIVPGILPVTNFNQAQRIAKMCKAKIPSRLESAMNESADADDQFKIGVDHAREQNDRFDSTRRPWCSLLCLE